MIFQASKEIEAAIQAQGWKCGVEEQADGQSSAVVTGFNLQCGAELEILFISAADNDAAVRVFQFIQAGPGQLELGRRACNDMNKMFRFAKFVLEDSGWVGIQMDMPVETTNVGQVGLELLMRLLNIAEEAYPLFQKQLGQGGGSPIITPNFSPNGDGRN